MGKQQPVKQKVATLDELPTFETATIDELPAFGEPVKKKGQPQVGMSSTLASKSVSQPTKSSSGSQLKAPKQGESQGLLLLDPSKKANKFDATNPAFYAPKESVTKPVTKKAQIVDETPKEQDFFTGSFGDALRLIDEYSPIGIGDYVDDMGRSIYSGYKAGAIVTPALELMLKSKKASPEQIKKYMIAAKEMESIGPSQEMQDFSKIYEDEGKGVWGFIKGLAYNPTVVPQILVNSISMMANPTTLSSAGAAIGTGAGYGAATGAVAGGVGAGPGAAAGALSAVPYAMGAASATLETGLTFSELLREELDKRNLEFNEANVKTILEDDKVVSSIRGRASARGAVIGIVDGLTGRLAGKVGAKLLGKTAASRVKAGLAAAGIEAVGGSTGEAGGRLVAGQEQDVAEIGLEGVAGAPMAIPSLAAEVLNRPTYKINGQKVTEADIEDIVTNTPAEDLAKINFEFKNDKSKWSKIIDEKVTAYSTKEEVRQANPDLNETTLDAVTKLELELQKLQGNKTQSGKDKSAVIKAQIKDLQENQLPEEVKVETLKPEENAVQEQTTSEVPVQPETRISGEVAQGEPQAEPQVPAEEVKVEEVKIPSETIEVFHGGNLPSLKEGKSLYVSEDASQANEYAKMSDGKVSKFLLDKNKIADEEDAYAVMEDLGLRTDANFFELIDPRFDEALSEKEIESVYDALKEKGFEAVRYTDINQNTLKPDIKNILVLDASKSLKTEPIPTKEVKVEEVKTEAPKKESVEGQMQSVFGLNKTQAKAASVVIDRIVGTMAGRAGTTKKEILKTISFEKGTPTEQTVTEEPVSKAEVISIPKPVEKVKPTKAAPKAKGPIDTEAKFNDAIDNQVISWNKFPEQKKGKEISSRNQELTKSANDLLNGKITNEEHIENISRLSPIKPIEVFFDPSTEQDIQGALEASKVPLVNSVTSKGETFIDPKTNHKFEIVSKIVGLRLDIPAFWNKNKWVVTIHVDAKDTKTGKTVKDKAVSYTGVAKIKNVTFDYNPNLASKIASGKLNRETRFKMRGELVPIEGANVDEQNANAKKEVEAIQNDPAWVQIGANPFRHSYFFNRSTGKPVLSADEVIQIGGLVYAKNVVEANWNDEKFAVTEKGKPVLDKKGNQVYFQDNKATVSIANDGRFIVTALTDPNISTPLHEMAHIYEHYLENKERQKILKWAGKKDWDMSVSEKFARGFEKYLSEGKSPSADLNKIFENFKKWLLNIYNGIIGSDIDIDLNKDMRRIYDIMLSEKGKQTKAPSVDKVLGKPAPKKVTVNEATALKDQIKLEVKAAKDGAAFVKNITKSVGETLKSMVKSGSITPAQQKTIANGLRSNLTNPTILDRFFKRIDRIMRIADYKEKVRQANAIKTKLATAAKRDKLKPELKDIAKALSKVQPSMLDNLQDYIDKAKEALAAMSPTKLVNGEVKESTLIDFKDFADYANKLLKKQNDAIEQDKIQEYENLKESGVISGDMSLKEIEAYLKKSEQEANFEENKEKEKALAEYAKASFDNSKDTIEGMIDNDEISEEDLPLIKGFMSINPDDMNPKMAVKAAEELRNYIHNGSKTGMGKILSEYLGAVGAKAMAKKTNVSKILSIGGVKNLVLRGIDAATGKVMGLVKLPGTNLSGWYSDSWIEYVSQIDNVGVTAMGEKNWLEFKKLSGFDEIVSGFVRNKKQIDAFTKDFVRKYEKKKVDGYNVFTTYNATQAGIIADLYREVGSTPEEVAENFKDRKEILRQYLDYMKGKVRYKFDYDMTKELYDKLGVEKATSGQEVFNNSPKLMQNVVNDMIKEWDNYYPNAKRVAEEQYGILLGQNKNYTPYRWKVVSNKISSTDPLYDKGGYVSDFDILDTEEAGTFKAVKPVKNLPTINNEVVRVPSYNFFQNNIDALTQTGNNINTIAGVNQFSGFTKSPYYKDIIKDDDSRNLLTSRMIYNISKLTDRERISTNKFTRGLLKVLNVFAGLGTRLGLGALTSAGTQALPALTNTLVNLEMNPVQMLRATRMILDPSEREWLNNLDATITGRGTESTTSLDYAEKMFANKDFGVPGDVVKGIADLTKVYVDYALVKSDVAAAKISWLSYYLTELEKKGVDVSNIKLSDTEVDKEAAKIADRKVQKEQNVNIAELSGKLFSSKSVGLRALRMSLLAFQSYTISARDKIKTNMSILFNPSNLSTAEEKIEAMNSIAATIAEQIVFSKIKAGIRNIVIAGAFAAVGEEESEEERKLREKRNQENSELNIFQALTGSFGVGDQEWDLDIINSVLDYFQGTIDQQEVERRLLEQEEKDMMDEERDSEYAVRLTPEDKKAERLQRSLDRPFRFYVPKVDSDDEGAKYARYLGSGKVLYDVLVNVVNETDNDIKRGGYYDKRGNFIEYNEDQLNKLKMLRNVAPAQLIGLTPSEVKTLTNEMRKIMKDRAYLNKMEAKDEERKAKLDQ